MFQCPRAVKHENNRDAAFLAVTSLPCVKDGKKGFAVSGHLIIIGPTRDYLSETGLIFISEEEAVRWHDYVPRK